MDSPQEPDDALDDEGLDRALDGAFADLTGSVLYGIGSRVGEVPQVSLRDVDPGEAAPLLKPLGPGDARAAGKYVIQGVLGRGGLGTVHRGHDQDLGRDVAMKFLRAKFKDDPAMLHRFVEEAQIGGQLQHPGIVPVYELGMSRGRPFFTMKMVRGQTLARRLAERASPASDRRTFLSIFEDVCQTIAYAHARGVVHRDLKPANVMIGSFGEVQVVDWGMGKVLAQGGVADERLALGAENPSAAVATVRSSGQDRSVAGTVFGTPAYMPPEQARGEVEGMDERSDVFALGAILCETLTGLPPYVGGEQGGLLARAARAELDDARARLSSCGAEPELVELATRCLMPAPADRPRSAEVVAKAVHDHLAAAEARVHEARVTAARAQERARALRRTQRLGIALIAVIAVGLAASLWFWLRAEDQRSRAERAAEAAVAAEEREAAARSAADANLANFDRLSHVVRLQRARAKERALFPAWPDRAAALQAWLRTEAGELRQALPDLRATLAVLEARALPGEASVAAAPRFANAADEFLHDTLQGLVADIEAFAKTRIPDVERRLFWAERVEELTITRFRDRWNEAREAISRADGVTASTLYAEAPLDLSPQVGLVPLGMNPHSKLWEFYHLRSAWDPEKESDPARLPMVEHDVDGNVDVHGRGMVFVLVPGGRFLMGAQPGDENVPNRDPGAERDEGPVHEVELAPYFLSKFEMTQGQWARLSGGEYPSWYRIGHSYPDTPRDNPLPITEDNPVEGVSWEECDRLATRHGLVLPTEARWERACRAGMPTPWSTGRASASLRGFANVLDRTGERGPPHWVGGEAFDDGYKGAAPVGSYEASPFGFHDMHGNVWEWCRDEYGRYDALQARAGDGLRVPNAATGFRMARGGNFSVAGSHARASNRLRLAPDTRSGTGMRPARDIR